MLQYLILIVIVIANSIVLLMRLIRKFEMCFHSKSGRDAKMDKEQVITLFCHLKSAAKTVKYQFQKFLFYLK